MSHVVAVRATGVRHTRRWKILVPAFAILGQLATLPFVGAVGAYGLAFLAAWAVLIEIN